MVKPRYFEEEVDGDLGLSGMVAFLSPEDVTVVVGGGVLTGALTIFSLWRVAVGFGVGFGSGFGTAGFVGMEVVFTIGLEPEGSGGLAPLGLELALGSGLA